MKNLFVITEEEKNRILGLHETATNNQYLINEQSSLNLMEESSKDLEVANSLGFPTVQSTKNNCQKVTIFDGQVYQNLMSYVCPNGYIDFKVLSDYKNTTISGSWVVSNQNVAITMSDGTKFTGTLTPGSLYKQVTSWLVKQQKFAEYVKGQGSEVQNTWKSWGGGESQSVPAQSQQEDQLSQNAKNCGWLKSDGTPDVDGYKNSKWECPKSGKVDGIGNRNTGGTYTGPSNAQKVQTKLKELDPGSPQTGKMDQETINKVMSLLNQGAKTPEQKQTYNVNQTLSNTKSDD